MIPSQSVGTILSRAVDIANHRDIETAERFLTRCAVLTFGVESVTSVSGDSLEYLNMGDTYTETLCRENDGEWFLSSWGDWLEQSESEYDIDNDTVGCGYCSHHTPIQNDEWHNTVCESCGRIVSNGELPSADTSDDSDDM